MIRRIIVSLVINGVCLYSVGQILPEDVAISGGLKFFIVGAIIISFLNLLVKPLLKIISFPLVFITGGLFLIAINAIILWFLEYAIIILDFNNVSFNVFGLKGYLYAAIIFGLVNWTSQWLFKLRR
ncbi:phage holin family protein [Patescibacteria group bacterium]|nr:phage holin family protein [Patescibacteria group bacterium]